MSLIRTILGSRNSTSKALVLGGNRAVVKPAQTKNSAALMWPSYDDDTGMLSWTLGDFGTYVDEGYSFNSLIYSAISFKIRAQQDAPLRAYTGDPLQPLPLPYDHPLSVLARRPNRYMSGVELQGLNTAYLNISGDAFMHLIRKKLEELPTEIWPLRPDCVKIVPGPDGRSLMGYAYARPGTAWKDAVPILPEDIIHVKLPNPRDPLGGLGYGLSPLAPLALSGDVDNMISRFLKQFFTYGAIPSGILKFNEIIDEDELKRIKRRWNDQYGGFKNWSEVGVLDQGGNFERIGLSFDEMGFETIDARNESRILGPLGVPPILLGTRRGLDRSTYSNYEEARKAFWEDTFRPEMSLYDQEEQNALHTDDGGFVAHDYSQVPALSQNVLPLVDSALKLWQMGTPAYLAYRTVGLRTIPRYLGDDISYMPAGVTPVGMEPVGPPSTEVAEPITEDSSTQEEQTAEVETQSESAPKFMRGGGTEQSVKPGVPKALTRAGYYVLSPEYRKAYWTKFDRSAQKWEKQFASAARAMFRQDLKELLVVVTKAKKKALRRKESVNWFDVLDNWNEICVEAGDRWRETFLPAITGLVGDWTNEMKVEFGSVFDTRNVLGEEWFNNYTQKFAQPIMDTTMDDLHTLEASALKEGWSIPEMQNHLTEVFDQYMNGGATGDDFKWFADRMPAYRTENIARTETIRASNAGAQGLLEAWGVEEKEWLATFDGRGRPEHMAANGQIVPVDRPFLVDGEELMYPGDPSGSPHNTCNCRCTELPVTKEVPPGEADKYMAASEGIASELDSADDFSSGTEMLSMMRSSELVAGTDEEIILGIITDPDMLIRQNMKVLGQMMQDSGITEEQAKSFLADVGYTKGKKRDPFQNSVDYGLRTWFRPEREVDRAYMAALQMKTNEVFGLGASSVMTGIDQAAIDRGMLMLDKHGDLLEAFLKAQYDRTQELLSKAGVNSISLYRGMQLESATDFFGVVDLKLHPLSSFTTDWRLASEYGGAKGAVFATKVPRERILSTFMTGLGFGGEREFVVLGGQTSARMLSWSAIEKSVLYPSMMDGTKITIDDFAKLMLEGLPGPAETQALGLSFFAPADVVEYAETKALENISWYATDNGLDIDVVEKQSLANLQALVDSNDVNIRVYDRYAVRVLEDGRFKTQFETGTSGGSLSPSLRSRAEVTMGIPVDIEPKLRPVYGFLGEQNSINNTGQYGSIRFVLKEEVKSRATLTLDDSLSGLIDGTLAPTPMTRITRQALGERGSVWIAMNKRWDNTNYIEAQIQGGVGVDDIKKIFIGKSTSPYELARITAFADKLGIPVEMGR